MEYSNFAVDLSSKTLENSAKKQKILAEGTEFDDENSKSLHTHLKSFKGFRSKKILYEDNTTKTIFVEGTFDSDSGTAILLLEKLPFSKDSVDKLLCEDTSLEQITHNDIYGGYNGFPKATLNGIKATIIHPATEKHIEKYVYRPMFMIQETPDVYNSVVLPYLVTQQLSVQWVYNILEHKEEVDRIVYEDLSPDVGFMLMSDMKWDGTNIDSLHVLAISQVRGIKTLRDLTSDHLPLLKNIKRKSLDTILEKYSIPESKLRVFLHYLPSYYHLHVHFTIIDNIVPGTQVERAHLLDNVISNLELCPEFYRKTTLVFAVKENHPLYIKMKESGIIV